MRAQSNDASPISQRVPKVDPRTVRSHMVRLGLAVKLAQGAFDAEHVARMEPSMMQHLAKSAESAARDDVLKAMARPGSKPTLAASAGVALPGQHAFDSPVKSYDLAAQRSLALAIQEKMQGDSSAAATAGPAWQSALRNAAASPRGVVASAISRPAEIATAASDAALTDPVAKKATWRPAMKPRNNPKTMHIPQAVSDDAGSGDAASQKPDGSSPGGRSVDSAFAFTQNALQTSGLLPKTSPLRGNGSGAATVRLRGNMSPEGGPSATALSLTSPSATLRPTTAPPGKVNFDLSDARNPVAALTFKQLDTEGGEWSPKQFRSRAGAQLAHLPQTLTDTAIKQADVQAARTQDRLLKASLYSPKSGPSLAMSAALAAGGSTLSLKSSPPPGVSETAYLAAYGPRPSAAGYSPARLVPSKEEPAIVVSAYPRFVPGTTSGPRIPPHPEQGPPEGSSPSSPLLLSQQRPSTALRSNSTSLGTSALFTSPLKSTATSFYGSLRPSTAPAGGDKAAQLLATHASMQSDAVASVEASKSTQVERRAAQRRRAQIEATRARQAMAYVQGAV